MKKLPALVLIAFAGPAAGEDWTFQASLYGWLPGISSSLDTSLGEITADKSTSDAIEDLDFAFMGTFEARYGRWGFIGDLITADLSASKDTPFGLAFSDADMKTSVTAFSGYAAYRVHDGSNALVDLAAGFRSFDVSLDASLDGNGTVSDRDFGADETWSVPLIGARVIVPFGGKWFGSAFADVGGLSGDNSTWQAFASVGYRFNARWSTQLGYRYMSIAKEIDGQDVEIDLSGPLLGVTARF